MWLNKTNFISHLDPAPSDASRILWDGPLPDEVPIEEPRHETEKPPIEEPDRAPGPPPTSDDPPVEVPWEDPPRPPMKSPPPKDPEHLHSRPLTRQ